MANELINRITKQTSFEGRSLLKYYVQLHNYIAMPPDDGNPEVTRHSLVQSFITLVQLAEHLGCTDRVDWEQVSALKEAMEEVASNGMIFSDDVYWMELLSRLGDMSKAVRLVEQYGKLDEVEKDYTAEQIEVLHVGLHIKAASYNLFDEVAKQLDSMEVVQ